MDRPKLAISFSGGRSSAVMTKLCLEKYGDSHDIVVTFANTGCEHPHHCGACTYGRATPTAVGKLKIARGRLHDEGSD